MDNPLDCLDFLKYYSGEKLTEADYVSAAATLSCEVAVIKAVAKVESGGRSGFDKLHRPVILFERHIFSEKTGHTFDNDHPDISWPSGYITRKQAKKGAIKTQKQIRTFVGHHSNAYDFYEGDDSYLRLARAYLLNKEAALQACSWGMFQVIGKNSNSLGYKSVFEMVKAIAKSEKGHLDAFVRFIKSVPICARGIQSKNWREIARGYNGKGYEKFDYHTRLEDAYNDLCE